MKELKNCPLFAEMTEEEVSHLLEWCRAEIIELKKEQYLFHQGDIPEKLPILLSGQVLIGNDTSSGKRRVVATIEEPGSIFGEIFLFLNQREYENYAQAAEDSRILLLPGWIFKAKPEGRMEQKERELHDKVLSNLLTVFAQKAYYLNQTLQILTLGNLRQKIARLFLTHLEENGRVGLQMNREAMASYLNTARPHLSRELMKMQDEGLIEIRKKEIYVKDQEALENL